MTRRSGARLRTAALAAATTALLAGCSGDKLSSVNPKGSEASKIAGAWWLIFALAVGVYAIVGGFIIVASLRGRRTDHGRPSRISDGAFLWLGGLIVPALILMVVAAVTVETTAAVRKPSRDALRVEVVGKDWWWAVRYPDSGVTTANEIRLPVGRPVEIRLTSDNVIHSFWVPNLAGKMDVIPGQPNTLRFTVDEPGVYRGQCAEFCGLQHANMAFYVIAQTPGMFDRWLTRHSQPPSEPAGELEAKGAAVFQRLACAGCHTVDGTQAQGTRGPNLTNLGERRTLGAGTVENTPENLARWIPDASSLKPGVLMPAIPISHSDLEAVVAYLESLE